MSPLPPLQSPRDDELALLVDAKLTDDEFGSDEAREADAPSLDVKFSGITLTAILIQFLGGSIYGYNTGVIAGALDPIDETFDVNTQMQQFITSSVLVGAMFGSLMSGSICDRLGRRKVALGFGILSLGCVTFLALSTSVTLLIVARGLLGLAVGGYSFVCPLYASEASPPAIRGILTSVIQIAITFSAFFAYLMNLAFQNTPEGWRYMFAIGGVPCLAVLLLAIFRMPESPRWLVLNGREDEARPVLGEIVGEKNVNDSIETIRQSLARAQMDGDRGSSWTDIFSMRLARHMFLGMTLAVANQFTGNNAVTYYAPKIFEEAGWDSGVVAVALTAGIGFWKFAAMGMVLFFKLFDRYGRRTLMLTGLSVMGFGALLLAISFFAFAQEVLSGIAIFCIAIFVAGFQMGPGPLFYVLCSEIFPDEIRGRAMSFVTAMQWMFNLVVATFFVTVMEEIGGGPAFFIFTGACTFCGVVLFSLCPETKGKTLDEIQTIMSKKHDG